MRTSRLTGALVTALLVTLVAGSAAAKAKTGVIDKKKVDGQTLEVFTDTVFGYTVTTPKGWDFKVQKENSKTERNPFRLRVVNKDKQMPTQLWDSPSAVVNAHIHFFIIATDMSPEDMRDSLASPTFKGEWQKPISKNCDMMHGSTFLNKAEVRWDKWHGSAFSVEQLYTAQIPTGGGLFGSVSEKRLAEFYVFPFRGQRLVVYMVTEREFLEENREVVKELLGQIDPQKS